MHVVCEIKERVFPCLGKLSCCTVSKLTAYRRHGRWRGWEYRRPRKRRGGFDDDDALQRQVDALLTPDLINAVMSDEVARIEAQVQRNREALDVFERVELEQLREQASRRPRRFFGRIFGR